jgi:hypothetical protein
MSEPEIIGIALLIAGAILAGVGIGLIVLGVKILRGKI